MHIKTGIDIIEVKRIQESIEKYGERFINRVFTSKEIEYCESKNVQKFQSYAGRFAAKEAIIKSISCSLENKFDVEWKNIEILNGKDGRPFVNLYGKIRKCIGTNCEIDISISHISKTAVASCVLQQL